MKAIKRNKIYSIRMEAYTNNIYNTYYLPGICFSFAAKYITRSPFRYNGLV